MATRLTVFLACTSLFTSLAWANEPAPLSAIDWLSDSVTLEQDSVAPETTPEARVPDDIQVLPLDMPVQDSAGLLDSEILALDRGLWGRSSAYDLARALDRVEDTPSAPPALRRFFVDLIRARLDPPIDAVIDNRFFLSRVDRLLTMGHLKDAAALIDAAGATDPEMFRRQFDIALLKGTETEACRKIEESPDLSPTYPTRIFCLARLGEWDVAALTLGNAESLGILTDREDKLLLHFLDPELFEEEPIPTAPRVPSPLLFRLYEAVGERIATSSLPVAFAVADLSETVGWKSRLRAAERLAAAGALSFEEMLAVYGERKPAASGTEWDRVSALQTLVRAVERQNTDNIVDALPAAWAAARGAEYHGPFATWVAPHLTALGDENRGADHLIFEIALLAGDANLAARFANQSNEDRFLLALAQGRNGQPPAGDPLARAALRGLAALGPGAGYEALLDDERGGEALFRALAQLIDGAAGNPDATAHSLALLRQLGLEALARQIAVELILMEGAA